LVVRGPEGFEHEIEAIIDTGFSGSLSLPASTIAALGLPFRRIGRAILADGKESLFNIFEATVEWNGKPCRIGVHAADTDPLIGMNLLYDENVKQFLASAYPPVICGLMSFDDQNR
jgi:clan AA aspartic protease